MSAVQIIPRNTKLKYAVAFEPGIGGVVVCLWGGVPQIWWCSRKLGSPQYRGPLYVATARACRKLGFSRARKGPRKGQWIKVKR